MKFNLAAPTLSCAKRLRRAFTLAEALAAIAFMAIVIPVALQGMHIASLAGEVAQRKVVAARIATRLINKFKVENTLQNGGQNGVEQENGISYRWTTKSGLWTSDPVLNMLEASVIVSFEAQGRTYQVQMSTVLPQVGQSGALLP